MFEPVWATLTTAGVGAVTWIGVAVIGGQVEAWDITWYLAALPVIGLMAGVVSYFVPTRFMISAAIGAVAGRKAAAR